MSDSLIGTDSVAQPSQMKRFFYNNNPFYLISCFLVIYGLQDWAIASGENGVVNLIEKSSIMAGGIAAYTLMMAVACVAVIRIGKIWEDARSIFLVVVISLVALSICFDEISILHHRLAVNFAIAGGIFVVAVSESLLRYCGLTLSVWYRFSLYAIFAVFFAAPPLLGHAVANQSDRIANGGAILFSTAIAASLLLLVPTMHFGPKSASNLTARDASAWRWPWYPLSAFVVLAVLAGIRTHAIWMSFGFDGDQVVFEPFLLLPILFSVIVLLTEAGISTNRRQLNLGVMLVAPALLACGMTEGGLTHLPIQSDLHYFCGSGWTLSIAAVLALYLHMTLRRVEHAEFGIPIGLLLAGFTAKLPQWANSLGLESWMIVAVAGGVLGWIAIRRFERDWLWTILATIMTASIVMAGRTYNLDRQGYAVACVFAVTSMMLIGASFETQLSEFLRSMAATCFVVGCGAAIYRFVFNHNEAFASVGLLSGLIIAFAYARWVRRRGWLYLSGLQALVIVGLIGYHSFESGRTSRINWPISAGMACFAIGAVITTSKTTIYARMREQRRLKIDGKQSLYRAGF